VKSRTKFVGTAAVLAVALLAQGAFAQVKGDANKGKAIAESTCVACHGVDGNGPVPNFPKLAGIDAGYLLKQLQDFKKKRRVNEVMAPMVEPLSDDDMANVAVHFAGQKMSAGTVKEPGLLEAGKKMWTDGNPTSGVPACSGCHGDKGQGDDRYPRLAGQYAEYVADQLAQFKAGKRKNDKRQMQAVADRMTEQDIKAVAEYVASLP